MSDRLENSVQVNESSLNIMPPPRRSVSFHSTCAVILIPSRKEYVDAGIDLWFNRKDQTAAQTQVANELKQLISYNPALTVETAMKFLYQPQIHLDAAMFAKDESEGVMPLNVMVVDRQEASAKEAANAIYMKLQSHNRWSLSVKHCTSGESAVKHFVSPSGYASILDVVLIDESIFTNGHQSAAAAVHSQSLNGLLNVFRSAYGSSVLIGICLSDSSDIEVIREYAVKIGVDFIWAKPINVFADMLPLILVSRAKSKSKGGGSSPQNGGVRKLHRDSMSNLLHEEMDIECPRASSSSTDGEECSSPLVSPFGSPTIFKSKTLGASPMRDTHRHQNAVGAASSVMPMLFSTDGNSQPMVI